MANYHAVIRTNYFSVTDEAKFREIIASCSAEGEIHIFEDMQEDGSKKFGFGCEARICGFRPGEDECPEQDDVYGLYYALQSILCKGDAILVTEIGREKLNYLVGLCMVITSDDMKSVDIGDEALKQARSMLGDEKFETKCEY